MPTAAPNPVPEGTPGTGPEDGDTLLAARRSPGPPSQPDVAHTAIISLDGDLHFLDGGDLVMDTASDSGMSSNVDTSQPNRTWLSSG